MRARLVMALAVSAITLAGGSLSAASASAATGQVAAAKAGPSAVTKKTPAGPSLPDVVSQTPVTYTPNVSGHASCGKLCKNSTVYATAVVNGEVVVAGAFSQACQVPAGASQCPNETGADYLLAFNIDTGAIDPGFAPVLNDGPVYALAAGPGDTVYAGGAFSSVNGTDTGGLAALTVDPGGSDDGTLVPGFDATTTGNVLSLALNGSALYVGGPFTQVDGTNEKGIARVNALTGALDTTFSFTLSDPISGTKLEVTTMSVTPDGTMLAIGGTFLEVDGQSIPRIALIDTGGGLGGTASLDDWMAPILSNNCSAEHDYINGIDFSPDGSYFAVATTGYKANGEPGICDAVARFDTGATGDDVQPVWINYTGGDSYHSITVVGNVIYAGGHNRWANNECGNNAVCEANAVLTNGLTAIDPNTGLALPWWHPQTLRKTGVQSLVAFTSAQDPGSDGGLIVGTDATTIGGAPHNEIAIFPEPSTAATVPGGSIPSGMFAQGRIGGGDESTAGTAEMCIADPGDNATSGTLVEFSTCDNDAGQIWTVETGGQIEVTSGLCLDTQGGGTAAGTDLVVDTCDGASTQQWAQGTGNTLLNVGASDLCVDDPGGNTSGGTNLEINSCDGAGEQVWPLPVTQAPPAPPPVGPLYPDETQSNSNVPCATSASNTPRAGKTKIELSNCLNYTKQNWTLEPDGELRLDGLCLDTQGEGTSSETYVVLSTCNGNPTQIWTSQPNLELTDGVGLCLDDPGFDTNTGTDIWVYTCNGGSNQQWRLPAD